MEVSSESERTEMDQAEPFVVMRGYEIIVQLFYLSLPLFFIIPRHSLILDMNHGVVIVISINLQAGHNLIVRKYRSMVIGNKIPRIVQM